MGLTFTTGAQNVFIAAAHCRVHTGCGAHPASHPLCKPTMLRATWTRSEPLIYICGTEINNAWSYTSTSPCVSKTWCLIKHMNAFTFHLYSFHGKILGYCMYHVHVSAEFRIWWFLRLSLIIRMVPMWTGIPPILTHVFVVFLNTFLVNSGIVATWTTASVLILPNSTFISPPVIRCYIVFDTDVIIK